MTASNYHRHCNRCKKSRFVIFFSKVYASQKNEDKVSHKSFSVVCRTTGCESTTSRQEQDVCTDVSRCAGRVGRPKIRRSMKNQGDYGTIPLDEQGSVARKVSSLQKIRVV